MSKYVHLHVYIPRTSERVKPTDDLMFYSILPVPESWTPPWDLTNQLNLFAGQLYLRDWDAYLRLSNFLNLEKGAREEKTRRGAWYNLFNLGSCDEFKKAHPNSLLPLVMTLLAIRRRGTPFEGTHMGKILQGRALTPSDFHFLAMTGSSHHSTTRDGHIQLSIRARSAPPFFPGSDVDCGDDNTLILSKPQQRFTRGVPETAVRVFVKAPPGAYEDDDFLRYATVHQFPTISKNALTVCLAALFMIDITLFHSDRT